MPVGTRTRKQRLIDDQYAVQKRQSPRTRAKSVHSGVESPAKSPRKRASPTAAVCGGQENIACSPTKKLCGTVDSPLKSRAVVELATSPQKRIPLSPRKDASVNSPVKPCSVVLSSPLKPHSSHLSSPIPKTPPRNIIASPRRVRALNFDSPAKNLRPLTPKKEASLVAKNLLFTSENDSVKESPASKSPSKRTASKSMATVKLAKQEGLCYQRAKQALHTALPDKLLCREKEAGIVDDFLTEHLDGKTPGSLYISGAPGTGKTAVLSHTLHRLKNTATCTTVYINCMTVRNPQGIFNKIVSQLLDKDVSMTTKQATKELEKLLCAKGKMVVMILDEMDQLDHGNQEILYTMFEWPTLAKSRLVLIGIANALDLTDRILPRLQARPKCRPQLLHFPPYTKDQVVTILKSRLQDLDDDCVMEPSALQFCAMKVAAVAGDMRRALDVCRRAVEAVETEVKKQSVLAVSKSPSKSRIPKKIGVAHILRIVNDVYGNRLTQTARGEETIPLQQKLTMCTMLLLVRSGRGKEVTMGKLHDAYAKVCKGQRVQPVDQSEFISMCVLTETRGILTIKKTKDMRNAKITLKLDEQELESTLKDKTLISNVLQKGLSQN